jgi:hypothetical protein
MDTTDQAFDPEDAGLSEDDTAKILNVEPGTLATWRSQGKGPKYRKTGRRIGTRLASSKNISAVAFAVLSLRQRGVCGARLALPEKSPGPGSHDPAIRGVFVHQTRAATRDN